MAWRFLVLLVTTFILSCFSGVAGSEPIAQSTTPSVETKSENAESLILQGTQQLDNYFLDEAKVLAEKALALSRDRKDRLSEGKALVLLGKVAYKLYDSNDRAAEFANQGLAIAKEVKDAALEARALLLLSDTMTSDENDKKQEQTQRALELARQAKDRNLEAEVLIALSDLAYNREEYEKYSDLVQQALTLAKSIGDRKVEFMAIARLGNLQKLDKEFDRALEFYNQALEIARSYGNRYDESVILGYNFVNVYSELKNIPKTVEYKQKALQVAQQAKNRRLEANYLVELGAIYHDDLKEYDKALDYWQKAIAVAKDAKAGSSQANALKNIGIYYLFEKKDYNKAITVFQEGLEVARAYSVQSWESDLLGRIAKAYKLLGDPKQTLVFYQKSYLVDFVRDKRNCISDETTAIAYAYKILEDSQKGLDFLQKAIAIEQKAQNRSCELKLLASLGNGYSSSGQTKLAIATYQKGLSLAKELKDRKQEGEMLRNIGYYSYVNLKDYKQGQVYYQQSLELSKEIGNLQFTAGGLFHLANMDKAQKRFQLALDKYQQSLIITRKRKDYSREIEILQAMSEIYAETNVPQQAESLLERLIAIAKKLRDPSLLTDRANDNLLNANPKNGLRLLTSAIALSREIGDRQEEGRSLLVLGNFHFSRGEYQQSQAILKESIEIAKQLKNRVLEATSTFLIGSSYQLLRESKQAIKYLNTALSIFREEKKLSLEGQTLAMLSIEYTSEGQPRKGLELAQQSFKIAQETKEALFQTSSILALALAHNGLNDLRQAYELAQQAFNLAQENKNPLVQMQAIAVQAGVFSELGDNLKSLDYAMQGLAIVQQMQSKDLEASFLTDIANLYKSLKEPAKALEYAEKALALSETSQDPKNKASARRYLAEMYASQKRYDRAIALINEAQAIVDKLEDTESNRKIKRRSLGLLAYIDRKLGKLEQAKAYLEEALAIPQPANEEPDPYYNIGVKLSLARVYRELKQPSKAAPLYQEYIASIESKRKNIRTLSADLQKSFVQDSIDLDNTRREDIYRELADALISLNRVSEAVQVLDLLKVREITGFLEGTRSSNSIPSNTSSPVPNSAQEPSQFDRKRYDNILATAITDAKERQQLRDLDEKLRSPDQKQRLEELLKRDKDLKAYFEQLVQSPEVVKTIAKLNQTAGGENLKLDKIGNLRTTLKKLPNTALFYPLILEDRIELILVTAETTPIYRTVKIDRKQLFSIISQFLSDIRDPDSEDVKKPARELYDLLILPIEKDLQQANVKTILYSPDGLLRYIPLSALYDGKQWLIERYANNIITATNLSNFTPSGEFKQLSVLAGAFPAQDVNDKSGNRSEPFKGLPFAITEVNKIAAKVPKTTKLIGLEFQRSITEAKMGESNYQVVHLATHGNFLPKDPSQSYIVFGDGETLKIKDIPTWPLDGINLFILSACDTAKGSISESSEGTEILGLGFQLTHNGAKAAIATLWKIDDGGTEALMERFYTYLPQGKFSPIDALQQSQIDLIKMPRSGKRNYSHPYYWAPFILIGNGF